MIATRVKIFTAETRRRGEILPLIHADDADLEGERIWKSVDTARSAKGCWPSAKC